MRGVHQHTGTNLIAVYADDQIYSDTPANYVLDGGVSPSALPGGAVERTYMQGTKHSLMDANGTVTGSGPMPWPEGDTAIANIGPVITAKHTRMANYRDPILQAMIDKDAPFLNDPDRNDLLNQLKGKTPAQIKNYVQTNINTLADVKLLQAKILLLLSNRVTT
jgi:hypothetical protein